MDGAFQARDRCDDRLTVLLESFERVGQRVARHTGVSPGHAQGSSSPCRPARCASGRTTSCRACPLPCVPNATSISARSRPASSTKRHNSSSISARSSTVSRGASWSSATCSAVRGTESTHRRIEPPGGARLPAVSADPQGRRGDEVWDWRRGSWADPGTFVGEVILGPDPADDFDRLVEKFVALFEVHSERRVLRPGDSRWPPRG
jgi:hypothetical protein